MKKSFLPFQPTCLQWGRNDLWQPMPGAVQRGRGRAPSSIRAVGPARLQTCSQSIEAWPYIGSQLPSCALFSYKIIIIIIVSDLKRQIMLGIGTFSFHRKARARLIISECKISRSERLGRERRGQYQYRCDNGRWRRLRARNLRSVQQETWLRLLVPWGRYWDHPGSTHSPIKGLRFYCGRREGATTISLATHKACAPRALSAGRCYC